MISVYSPQMAVTVNTTKYTIENEMTELKRREKMEKTNIHTNKYSVFRPIEGDISETVQDRR